MKTENSLQNARAGYVPQLPKSLQEITLLDVEEGESVSPPAEYVEALQKLFPKTFGQPTLRFQKGTPKPCPPLKVGVVFSGGQAAGGHNVITGLSDALQKLNPKSRLIGFCGGPSGIAANQFLELTESLLKPYRNQGGFDLIGSGRTKIETPDQFEAAVKTVSAHDLDGFVIIGGDDSNTNAALLAEHFEGKGVKCKVVGIPKTIDGDLKNAYVETSFGFDSACKTYSEIIGNIARDALSAKKYTFFIKLMGRSASHVTLECAMQTHPNLAFIGEEVAQEKKTLKRIVDEICDLMEARAKKGKDYSIILIPEGILEFIPEVGNLIKELNALLGKVKEADAVRQQLSNNSRQCFESLPQEFQTQLLLDRDPHGNIQFSKIETERLLIQMVTKELKNRKARGSYEGRFSAQAFFCGYEGRSCFPSNFDCQYCYALGHVAALLIRSGATGYMSCIQNLTAPTEEWTAAGIPLIAMMGMEERKGKVMPVIKKTLVNLQGKLFQEFKASRDTWALEDDYRYPGPTQFFGPQELTDNTTHTLRLQIAD